jgi:aminoglycoside 3-N-acetyltransferase
MISQTRPESTNSWPGLPASLSALNLERQLAALNPTSPLMVHSSMRRLGTVDGGPSTVVAALRKTLGPRGTLVVPAFTPQNSDSSPQYLDRVRGMSEAEVEAVKDSMDPFDPATTTASTMGMLAEAVRQTPGALRSRHPQTSFAAVGSSAAEIISGHRQDCHLGEESPLARLYEMDAQVLLMGVGFEVLTAFHLAEYRVPNPPRRDYNCVIRTPGGERIWWQYEDVALDDSDFDRIGAAFEQEVSGAVRSGRVGSTTCRLLSLRKAVDFAQEWLPSHRM